MGLHSYSQPSSSSSLQVWSSGWSSGQPEVNFRPPTSGIPDKCFCGGETVLKCSKSDETRGRIFLGCREHEDGDGGDHIMKWWDEAITEELQELKSQAAYLARQDTEDTIWLKQELSKVKAQMEESERRRLELVKNMLLVGIILIAALVSLVI